MSKRSGSATVLVLFLSAALMLIASALWRGAGASFSDALTGAAALQARLAAESAVRRTIAAGRPLPPVRAGTSTPLPGAVLVPGSPGVRSVVSALRVTPELYRIEATGTAGQPAAFSSVAFLMWTLDPGSRVRAFGSVAAAGGVVQVRAGGTLTGASVTAPPPPWASSECSSVQSLADSIFPSGAAVASAMDTTGAPGLGLIDHTALIATGRPVSGTGTPIPRMAGGVCVTADPWNWGSPTVPSGPCGSHRPLTTSAGDLLVTGGEGQGVLVVQGSLHLTAGARYFGVVLASGDVIVDQGSRLDGFVRAAGSVVIGATSGVSGSACAGLLALGAAPLKSVIPVPAGWVDPF